MSRLHDLNVNKHISHIASIAQIEKKHYCIVFKYLYSAPQQPWANRGAFGTSGLSTYKLNSQTTVSFLIPAFNKLWVTTHFWVTKLCQVGHLFFGKYYFFCHLFVNSKNSRYKLQSNNFVCQFLNDVHKSAYCQADFLSKF